eukprot:evm.model.scf_19.2 EVM.evm.TU.scf_19.2   scf_19:28826-30502(-)
MRHRSLLRSGARNSDADKKLFRTSKRGNATAAEEALDEGANVEAKFGWDDQTPLLVATRKGHLEVVELLIRAGANVEGASLGGVTPVAEACIQGHLEVLLALLRAGASPHKSVAYGRQRKRLRTAADRKKSELEQALLNAGLQVEGANVMGDTPLMLASVFAHPHIVETLLRWDAVVGQANRHGATALHYACYGRSPESAAIVRMLLEAGGDANLPDTLGETPLFYAVIGGGADTVGVLLEAGVAVNATNKRGQTPIFFSAFGNSVRVMNVLLEAGADLGVLDSKGNTPLFLTASVGTARAARTLVQAGAKVDAANKAGETALFEAVSADRLGIVRYLLEAGANVSATNRRGETPLHRAAFWGSFKAVEFLLERGADLTAVDRNGDTALSSLCGCETVGKRKRDICYGFGCSRKNKRASAENLLAS